MLLGEHYSSSEEEEPIAMPVSFSADAINTTNPIHESLPSNENLERQILNFQSKRSGGDDDLEEDAEKYLVCETVDSGKGLSICFNSQSCMSRFLPSLYRFCSKENCKILSFVQTKI